MGTSIGARAFIADAPSNRPTAAAFMRQGRGARRQKIIEQDTIFGRPILYTTTARRGW